MRAASYRAKPGYFVSENNMRVVAPSIFATTAHESRTARFTPISTFDVIQGLQGAGFRPVAVQQSGVRDDSRGDFTKHAVRLQTAAAARAVGDAVPEVVIINANDGSSSYQMSAGLFRLVCLNGMVVADGVVHQIRIRHTGQVIDDVIEGANTIVGEFQRVNEHVARFKAKILDPEEQRCFALRALDLDDKAGSVLVESVLNARRPEDVASDLWTTFNRVQENLLGGGLRRISATGRRGRTRPVVSIDRNTDLNKRLWALAEEFSN